MSGLAREPKSQIRNHPSAAAGEAAIPAEHPPGSFPAGDAQKLPQALWRNRRFLLLLGSFSIVTFGNTFYSIALNLWILQKTGSAKMMAGFTVASLLLSFALGSVAGTTADRRNRRSVMLTADLSSSALVLAAAFILALPQGVPFAAILLLHGLITVSGLFQSPAYQASVTTVVGKDKIQQAVGLLNLSENLCRTAGFSAGGIFVAAFGAAGAVLIDGIAFLLSALLVFFTRSLPTLTRSHVDSVPPAPRDEPAAEPPVKRSFFRDLAEGVQYAWNHPFSRAVMVLLPLLTLFFMPSMMLTQVMAVTVWRASPFQFGLMEASIPLGYMAGSAIIVVFGHSLRRRGRLAMGSMLALGPLYLALSRCSSAVAAIPVILLIGFAFAFSTMLVQIILRQEVPGELQGRVFGVLGSVMGIAPSVGLTAISILSDRFSPAPVMAGLGILLLVFAVCAAAAFPAVRNYR